MYPCRVIFNFAEISQKENAVFQQSDPTTSTVCDCKYLFNTAKMTYPFETDPVSRLIYVYIQVDEDIKFRMMFDTGATNTTFDINALIVAGFPVGNVVGVNTVETAIGMMKVDVIETKSISAFGHTVRGMKVQMYDF